MIEESYVDFECAKLLKKKGFDGSCDWFYTEEGGEREQLSLYELNYLYESFIKAPSLALAMRWLREVHNLFISLRIVDGLYIYVIDDASCYDGVKELEITAHLNFIAYQSPEEASEAAVKYCLENLI